MYLSLVILMSEKRIEMKEEQVKRLTWLVMKLGINPLTEGAIKARAGGRLALACAGAVNELKFMSANKNESELERAEEKKIVSEINAIIFDLNNENLNALMGFGKRPE